MVRILAVIFGYRILDIFQFHGHGEPVAGEQYEYVVVLNFVFGDFGLYKIAKRLQTITVRKCTRTISVRNVFLEIGKTFAHH